MILAAACLVALALRQGIGRVAGPSSLALEASAEATSCDTGLFGGPAARCELVRESARPKAQQCRRCECDCDMPRWQADGARSDGLTGILRRTRQRVGDRSHYLRLKHASSAQLCPHRQRVVAVGGARGHGSPLHCVQQHDPPAYRTQRTLLPWPTALECCAKQPCGAHSRLRARPPLRPKGAAPRLQADRRWAGCGMGRRM